MKRKSFWYSIVGLTLLLCVGAKFSDLRNAPVANSSLQSTDFLVAVTGTGTSNFLDSSLAFSELDKRYLKPGSNLSELADFSASRSNLGLGSASLLASSAVAQTANNLSDVASVSATRTNLGLGGAALLNIGTSTGTAAAGDDSRIVGAAQKSSNLSDLASASAGRTNLGLGTASLLASSAVAQTANNLSDLASAGTARTNLGLGGASLLNVGTTTGTAAAGDDSRIVGAAQKANNLSDLTSASSARTNLGLGSASLLASSAVAQTANNLSDVGSASTARTNLGLGGAAVLNVGTTSGTVAAGNDSRIVGAAPLASPSLSGVPLAPTASAGANSTQIATTAYVDGTYLSTGSAGSTYVPLSSANQANGYLQLDVSGNAAVAMLQLYDTYANISGQTLANGRLAYAYDTGQFFIGKNGTNTLLNAGGLGAGSCVVVQDSGNATTNGTNLIAAYAAAALLTPNGAALSQSNRAMVLLMPAVYNVGACSNSDGTFPNYGMKLGSNFVDLVGFGAPPHYQVDFNEVSSNAGPQGISVTDSGVLITGTLTGTRTLLTTDGCCILKITADDHRLRNLTIVPVAGGTGAYTAAGIYFFNNTAMSGVAVWEDVFINQLVASTQILACVCDGSGNAGWAGTYRRVQSNQPFLFFSHGTAGSNNTHTALWEDCVGASNAWNSYSKTYTGSTLRRCRRQGAQCDVPLVSTWTAGGATSQSQVTGTSPSVSCAFAQCLIENCSFDNTQTINVAGPCLYLSGSLNTLQGNKLTTAGSAEGFSLDAASAVTYYGSGNWLPAGCSTNVSNASEFRQTLVTSRATTGTGTDEALQLTTLPNSASTTGDGLYKPSGLSNNGESYGFEFWGTFGANGNSKDAKLWYGGATPTSGTKVFDSGALTNNGDKWLLKGRVTRVTATSQIITGSFSTTSGTGNATFYTTTSVTLTSTNNIELTGNTPTAASDIVVTYSDIGWNKVY